MTLVYLILGLAALAVVGVFVSRLYFRNETLLPNDEQIARAARTGDWTSAIRSYRALHGVGLRAAREQVEMLARSDSGEDENVRQ
jgi:hypothetical protein